MSFQLVPKSVTLNDLERRNGRYSALGWRHHICQMIGSSLSPPGRRHQLRSSDNFKCTIMQLHQFTSWRSSIRCCLTMPLEHSFYTCPSTWFVLGHLPPQIEKVKTYLTVRRTGCCFQAMCFTYLQWRCKAYPVGLVTARIVELELEERGTKMSRYYGVSRYFLAILIMASRRWYRPTLLISVTTINLKKQ